MVPKQAYPAFGLNPSATLDEARTRIKQINKEKKIERNKAASIARKVAKIEFYEAVFFPQADVDEFVTKVTKASAGTDNYKIRLIGGFKFVQKMIMELKLLPHAYGDHAADFYDYFAEQKISVDYASEILQMLNSWGRYVAKKHSSYFEPVPKIPKTFKKKIAKAQRTKSGVRTESDQLTVELLMFLKTKLDEQEYNWMYCALWLGLRPIEVDTVSAEGPLIIRHRSGSTDVLKVNQSKIEGESEDDSLKYIPLIYDEQMKAIELLRAKNVKRPKPKKLKAVTHQNIDTYSGRKGCIDLMQSRGQRFEDVSLWVGHKDIKTSLKHYKDASNVPFTEVKSTTKEEAV